MPAADATFDRFLAGIPIARSLGFALENSDADRVALSMPVDEGSLQIERVVHGGLIATLADTAAVWLLHRDIPSDLRMTGIDLTLHFLRPAVGHRGQIVASARAVRRGRTVSVVEVDVSQSGALVAKGLFTYLIRPR